MSRRRIAAFFFVPAAILPLFLVSRGSAADCAESLRTVPTVPCGARDAARRDDPIDSLLARYSSPASAALFGRPVDDAFVARELSRLASRLASETSGREAPSRVVAAMNRLVLGAEGFAYDPSPSDPEDYLIDRVLERKRGNCLGMTVLYLALAERAGVPLRGVYVPGHCFARYDDGKTRINVEFAAGGANWDDARYERVFGVSRDGPYLRSLDRKEMAGIYLKTLGAACARKGLYALASRFYDEAACCYPGLPDAYYNAGVLAMKKGNADEAISQYRLALARDPRHAAARSNLGAALAGRGRLAEGLREAKEAVALAPGDVVARANLGWLYVSSGMTAEGIREFQRVLEVDGSNARALSGLVRAYFLRGEYGDALAYCDRAETAGCRIDPSLRRSVVRGLASSRN